MASTPSRTADTASDPRRRNADRATWLVDLGARSGAAAARWGSWGCPYRATT